IGKTGASSSRLANSSITYLNRMKKVSRCFLFLLIVAMVTSCAPKITQLGKASYYADKFKNRPTASGERYKPGRLTAAHKTLPDGTKVSVINRRNGQRVKVVIKDRGAFISVCV